MVSMAPNLGWRDVPLGERLAAALDLPVPIAVANEADLGALAEHRRGAARGFDDVLFISARSGRRRRAHRRWRAADGRCRLRGEVGHIPVNPDGLPCRCGSIGCWETEVGERALLRRAGRPRRAATSRRRGPRRGRGRRSAALAAFAETGPLAGHRPRRLVNVLNPRPRLLGGRSGRELPVRPVDPRGRARPARPARLPPLVRVVPTSLATDAPLLGAAELAFEPLLADPAAWLRPRACPGRAWQAPEDRRRKEGLRRPERRGEADGHRAQDSVIA